MKKRQGIQLLMLMILLTFLFHTATGQSYKILIKKADSLYSIKKYKNSFKVYQQAFAFGKNNGNDFYNAACAAALAGDNRGSFKFLELALKNGWIDIDHLQKDTDLDGLHNDKNWPLFRDKMKAKNDSVEQNYDKPLQSELLAILSDDQSIRHQYTMMTKKLRYKNATVDSLNKVIDHKDSINLGKVSKILDQRGWVGKDKVGEEANETFFYVIQHADQATREKYLPMMKRAVKAGNATSYDLALLEDRVALGSGRKQLYGSQIRRDEKTNRFYIAPIEDPDHVDNRRAAMGLNPMSEYVRTWGIKWNLEEYKKQLPELEALDRKIYSVEKK